MAKGVLPHGLGADLSLYSNPGTPESIDDSPPPTISKKRKLNGDNQMNVSAKNDIKRARNGINESENVLDEAAVEKKFRWFGIDPFPDHNSPTSEECEEVHRILTETHGVYEQPAKLPLPSLKKAGCGDVPDVLDALLRVKISGATTIDNANTSIVELAKTFGTRQYAGGPPSINWEAVHQADVNEIINAIRRGGLATKKSHEIKTILRLVLRENLNRQESLLAEQRSGQQANSTETDSKTQQQKTIDLARLNETLLTLDHLLQLDTIPAIKNLIKFPGIGIKSAACVILFCFQRPSFAVDTHVGRLSHWLGWVPEGKDVNKTYAHCELRVPDHLKYGLHQLMLKHGQDCHRCQGNTKSGTKAWQDCKCPLEHLMTRSWKDGGSKPKKAVVGKKKKIVTEDGDSDYD